jgi:uracil phosphoribosyltransferase
MLDSFLGVVPEAKVGKILIQRNEETAGVIFQHFNHYKNNIYVVEPVLFYSKFPKLLNRRIFILDPMLATGASVFIY